MSDIDDLDRELSEATAAATSAALTPEETERARKLAQLEEAKAAARAAESTRRKIAGDKLEREARAEAQGRYRVKFFDLAALLPDVPSDKIPGGGVLVLRSHPPDVKRTWDREIEAKAQHIDETNANLVCGSIVRPVLQGPEGIRFRAFLESELGCGIANQMAGPVLALGGANLEEAKRGRR